MRLYVKKLLQILLAGFLLVVIYLNLNVMDMGFDAQHRNGALPWGGNFRHAPRHLPTFFGKGIHDYVLHNRLMQNSSRPFVLKRPSIYPSLDQYSDDRIVSQLQFIPQSLQDQKEVPLKKILVYSGLSSWSIPRGQTLFKEQKCAVSSCTLLDEHSKLDEADVVLFQHAVTQRDHKKSMNQIWALFMLESPYHTMTFSSSRSFFNWTATYRHDSTIVAPYEKFVPFNSSVQPPRPKNYAEGKTKKVAWFVSNCGARNGRRQYANELSQYIQVDIYGACGRLKCPRFQNNKCFEMLNKDYKFYLAFENSNCRDYITEKFFINGLK